MRSVCLGERILCGQETLCCRAVSFTFSFFLECIGDCNWSITQVLPIHSFHSCIRGIKTCKVDECKTFGVACLGISHNFRGLENNTKSTKCVIEQLFINLWIKISNENVCTNIKILIVCRCLVYSDWFPIHFYHVHHFDGVISILLTKKFNEPITLMQLGYTIFRHVNIHNWPCLEKKFPQKSL